MRVSGIHACYLRLEFLGMDFFLKVPDLNIKGDTNNTLYEARNKITSQTFSG